jgi:hypothetical protein
LYKVGEWQISPGLSKESYDRLSEYAFCKLKQENDIPERKVENVQFIVINFSCGKINSEKKYLFGHVHQNPNELEKFYCELSNLRV